MALFECGQAVGGRPARQGQHARSEFTLHLEGLLPQTDTGQGRPVAGDTQGFDTRLQPIQSQSRPEPQVQRCEVRRRDAGALRQRRDKIGRASCRERVYSNV